MRDSDDIIKPDPRMMAVTSSLTIHADVEIKNDR